MPEVLNPFPSLCRRLNLAALLACAGLGTAFAETTLVPDSPFAPAGSPAGAAAAAAESYQLAGSSSEGNDVKVCIFAQQTKHSQWISVGGESDGIHVVSYDPVRDMAVVVVAGSKKELTMRKAVVASTGPLPAARTFAAAAASPQAPSPIAAAPNATPEKLAQDQREARMLVSDLLEIGVQQRKAYQEAKMKAASGTPPPPEN